MIKVNTQKLAWLFGCELKNENVSSDRKTTYLQAKPNYNYTTLKSETQFSMRADFYNACWNSIHNS